MYEWKETWIIYALNELLDILMIFHVGVTFSPLHEGLLTRAFNNQNAQNGDGNAAAAAGEHIE